MTRTWPGSLAESSRFGRASLGTANDEATTSHYPQAGQIKSRPERRCVQLTNENPEPEPEDEEAEDGAEEGEAEEAGAEGGDEAGEAEEKKDE